VIVRQENDPATPLSLDQLKGVYHAYKGEKEEAYLCAGRLLKVVEDNPVANSPFFAYLSLIYLLLGENEKALDLLLSGVKYRSAPFLFIKIESDWDNLRNHPKYINATKFLNPEATWLKPEPGFRKYKKTSLPEDAAKKLKAALKERMAKEQPYLDPKLNLSDLAEMIQCSPNQLSQLLNEDIGKNFYDYVNEYRLRYFRELNRDPKNKQFTLLSLAYESGFNSKTTFNNFFKKSLGITPSEYLK
jgi:AraC-like DNA-binding protein